MLWMAGVKKGPVVEPVDDAPRFIFVDHNKFVKSRAKRWARESLVYVENKGSPYMLTRNMETCKYTNRSIEAWEVEASGFTYGLKYNCVYQISNGGAREEKSRTLVVNCPKRKWQFYTMRVDLLILGGEQRRSRDSRNT